MAHVLIVYAHPEPLSFNGAMKNRAMSALTLAGHAVRVSDLYAMRFDPVAAPAQFQQPLDPTFFRLQDEQRHAAATGGHAADVLAEHEKLLWADLVVFQFPLWWGSMPAIMKGWVDRVFSVGTVYGKGTAGLVGRQALLAVTTSARGGVAGAAAEGGGPAAQPEVDQVKSELSHVLNNMLLLARLEALEPFFVFGASGLNEAKRRQCLDLYQERLLHIAAAIDTGRNTDHGHETVPALHR